MYHRSIQAPLPGATRVHHQIFLLRTCGQVLTVSRDMQLSYQ